MRRIHYFVVHCQKWNTVNRLLVSYYYQGGIEPYSSLGIDWWILVSCGSETRLLMIPVKDFTQRGNPSLLFYLPICWQHVTFRLSEFIVCFRSVDAKCCLLALMTSVWGKRFPSHIESQVLHFTFHICCYCNNNIVFL